MENIKRIKIKNKVLYYNQLTVPALRRNGNQIKNIDNEIYSYNNTLYKSRHINRDFKKDFDLSMNNLNLNRSDFNYFTNYNLSKNLYNNSNSCYNHRITNSNNTISYTPMEHYYQNLYTKSKDKINKLKNKNSLNEQTIIDLINDKRDLIENNEKLEKIIDEYKIICNNKTIEPENNKIVIENNKLIKDNESLHNELNKLIKDNIELKLKIRDINISNFSSNIKKIEQNNYSTININSECAARNNTPVRINNTHNNNSSQKYVLEIKPNFNKLLQNMKISEKNSKRRANTTNRKEKNNIDNNELNTNKQKLKEALNKIEKYKVYEKKYNEIAYEYNKLIKEINNIKKSIGVINNKNKEFQKKVNDLQEINNNLKKINNKQKKELDNLKIIYGNKVSVVNYSNDEVNEKEEIIDLPRQMNKNDLKKYQCNTDNISNENKNKNKNKEKEIIDIIQYNELKLYNNKLTKKINELNEKIKEKETLIISQNEKIDSAFNEIKVLKNENKKIKQKSNKSENISKSKYNTNSNKFNNIKNNNEGKRKNNNNLLFDINYLMDQNKKLKEKNKEINTKYELLKKQMKGIDKRCGNNNNKIKNNNTLHICSLLGFNVFNKKENNELSHVSKSKLNKPNTIKSKEYELNEKDNKKFHLTYDREIEMIIINEKKEKIHKIRKNEKSSKTNENEEKIVNIDNGLLLNNENKQLKDAYNKLKEDYDHLLNENTNLIKEKEELIQQNQILENIINNNENILDNINDIDIKFNDINEENNNFESENNNNGNDINDNNINIEDNALSLKETNENLKLKISTLQRQKMQCEQKLLNFQKLFNSELEKEKKKLSKLIQKEIEKDKDKEKLPNDKNNENDDSFQENIILKDLVKELKSEIYELRQNFIKSNNNMNIIRKENEKLKKENYIYFKEVQTLNNYILKLEKGLGLDNEINNLKTMTAEQNKLIMNLSEQIKEYQSKVDNIIIGKSPEEKDEQIKLLVNEVKGVRSRILNIITFEGRIQNIDELISILNEIKNEINDSKNNKIKEAYKKLNEFIECYQLNNEKAFNNIMLEIFKLNPNTNNNNKIVNI